MKLENVTDKWEEAAQSTEAQAHIHPSGAQSPENYEASGRFQALEVRDVASTILNGNPNPRLVDFGCGDGRVSSHLAEHFDDLWGVDASPTMLERFKERVPTAQTVLSNGIDGGLKDLRADLLFSWAVFIHHNHSEGARLLQGIASGVKKGGILALQLPIYVNPSEGDDWCSVTVWTPALFKAAAHNAGLFILEQHVSPRSFSYEEVGEHHNRLQILRVN